MKTNSLLITIFVFERAPTRAQRVNPFLSVGSRESKAEVVSRTDLLMQSLFSQEG